LLEASLQCAIAPLLIDNNNIPDFFIVCKSFSFLKIFVFFAVIYLQNLTNRFVIDEAKAQGAYNAEHFHYYEI
jgi:hypothetical protein